MAERISVSKLKQLLERLNCERLKKFILSDKNHYQHHHASKVPTGLFSGENTYFHRERVNLGRHVVDVIKANNELHHFVWRTNAKNILQAQRDGVLQFESLTSQVIHAMGKYTKEGYYRAYKDGIISDKYPQKMALLRYTQAKVTALQPLERLVNDYDRSLTSKENLHRVKKVLAEYQQVLSNLLEEHSENLSIIEGYDRDVLNTFTGKFKEDASRITLYLDSLGHVDNAYKAYGTESLNAFIKQQLITLIRETQMVNQNLTYSRKAKSLLRGKFNSFMEDSFRVVGDYEFDLHNPVTQEHQGNFSDKDGIIANDFSFLGKNHLEIQQTLMTLAQIEKVDTLRNLGNGKYQLRTESGHRFCLKTTRFTNWHINTTPHYIFFRTACWVWNIVVGLSVGLTYDLAVGIVSGLSGNKVTSVASKLQILRLPSLHSESGYLKLAEK